MANTYKENVPCSFCGKNIEKRRIGKFYKSGLIRYKEHFCNSSCQLKHYHKEGILKNSKHDNYLASKIPDKEIEKKYRAGAKIKDLAKEYDVAKTTIRRHLEWQGMSSKGKRKRLTRIDSKVKKKILSDFKRKETIFKLMQKYKTGYQTIRKIIIASGLPLDMNAYNHLASRGISDKVVEKKMSEQGYKTILCGNVCINSGELPIAFCKKCPIKNAGKLKYKSYYDFVAKKEEKVYIVEVKKDNDSFSYTQVCGLLHLISKKIPVLIIRTSGDKNEIINIESFEY